MNIINFILRLYNLLLYKYGNINSLSKKETLMYIESMAFATGVDGIFKPFNIIDYKYLLIFEEYSDVNIFIKDMEDYDFSKKNMLDKVYLNILKGRTDDKNRI